MTGLPEEVVTSSRGFIRDAYVKHLRSGEGKIVSRYDATFAAADPYPEQETARGPDPLLDGVTRAYGGAFSAYARDELGFKTEMTYILLRPATSPANGIGAKAPGARTRQRRRGHPRACSRSSHRSGCMIAHGYSDMVTPYAASRYVLDHLPPIGDPVARAASHLSRRPHVLSRCRIAPRLHRRRQRRSTTPSHDARAMLASKRGRSSDRDHFIPVRKVDILDALIEHGALASEAETRASSARSAACWRRSITTNISRSSNGCATTISISIPSSTRMRVFDRGALDARLCGAASNRSPPCSRARTSSSVARRCHALARRTRHVARRASRPRSTIIATCRFFRRGHHKETVRGHDAGSGCASTRSSRSSTTMSCCSWR